jgi:hypothetical protein
MPMNHLAQEKINQAPPGYYIIKVESVGSWMLSISNSDSPDFVSRILMNLFCPSYLEVEAGLPFTFNVEISGTTGNSNEK